MIEGVAFCLTCGVWLCALFVVASVVTALGDWAARPRGRVSRAAVLAAERRRRR